MRVWILLLLASILPRFAVGAGPLEFPVRAIVVPNIPSAPVVQTTVTCTRVSAVLGDEVGVTTVTMAVGDVRSTRTYAPIRIRCDSELSPPEREAGTAVEWLIIDSKRAITRDAIIPVYNGRLPKLPAGRYLCIPPAGLDVIVTACANAHQAPTLRHKSTHVVLDPREFGYVYVAKGTVSPLTDSSPRGAVRFAAHAVTELQDKGETCELTVTVTSTQLEGTGSRFAYYRRPMNPLVAVCVGDGILGHVKITRLSSEYDLKADTGRHRVTCVLTPSDVAPLLAVLSEGKPVALLASYDINGYRSNHGYILTVNDCDQLSAAIHRWLDRNW